jgi:hypothetical protein
MAILASISELCRRLVLCCRAENKKAESGAAGSSACRCVRVKLFAKASSIKRLRGP